MRVDYHPAVEGELTEIRRYYEDCFPGLGAQFVDEFERQVLALAAAPERWVLIAEGIRRCLMRRFPYVIYFRTIGADRIRITVVKHQRRHPQYGRERK